jgi:voltage-gated potassium channel
MRARLERLMNNRATDVAVVTLILSSVALLLLEAVLPADHPLSSWAAEVGEGLTLLFCVELLLRFVAMKNRRRFLAFYWLDVLSVLPLARAFRIFRVLRILRLFRVGVLLNRRMLNMGNAVRRSRTELVSMVVVVLILVLAGTIAIHMAEGGNGPAFATLLSSGWWAVFAVAAQSPVTGMPQTALGNVITLVLMLGGMGFFAMFTGIVSAAMVQRLGRNLEVREMALEDLKDHVVICGWARMGQSVLEEFHHDPVFSKKAVVVVAEREQPPDVDPSVIDPSRFFFIQGDPTRVEVLREAGIDRASTAILIADKSLNRSDQDRDARTVLAALTVERLNPKIFTCVELLNRANYSHLGLAGVEEILVPDEHAGSVLATACRHRGIIALLDKILSSKDENRFFRVAVPPTWIGKEVRQLFGLLKELQNATLLSIERLAPSTDGRTSPTREIVLNPASSERLRDGDHLVLLSDREPTLGGRIETPMEPTPAPLR